MVSMLLGVLGIATAATTQKTKTYEAEDATIVGGTLRTWGSGYSGTGAMSLPNATGDSIEWTVTSDHAGPAKLLFQYALGGIDRPLEIRVNGVIVVASQSFLPATQWDRWGTTAAIPVVLNAGSNTVKVTTIGSRGPTLDYLRVIETIPLSGEIMTVYDGANLTGTSATVDATHVIYSGPTIAGSLDNQISSFILAAGYMAVIADAPDGTNPSKVYIATDEPLTVNTLPAEFNNAISFVRVLPWIHSQKKGFCGGDDAYRSPIDHSWLYNWTKGEAKGQEVSGIEFAPMCWDERFVQIEDYLAQDQVTHLLSFNEPDGENQANMPDTVAAVGLHKELQKAGLRLGSPACEENASFVDGRWLPEFMTEADAQGVRVDYINLHWYDWGSSPGANPNPDPVEVASRLKRYLSNAYKRYRKPIWITEFNANPARPRSVQNGFIQEILPYLDDLAYVERYAYYQWNDTMNFVDTTTGELTTTGQIYSDHQSTTAYLSTEVPAEWTSTDIGGAATGDTLYNGSYTVVGSGRGIRGTDDGCRFVYQPISGDVTITAKVTSQIWRNNLSMTGVMIRENLDSDSKQATMALSTRQGSRFHTRTTTGGSITSVNDLEIPQYDYWVRLVRQGDTITGFQSPDGITWEQLGSPSIISMDMDVYVGMVVTSNNENAFNDVIIKNVSVTPSLGQSLYQDWTRKSFVGSFTDTAPTSNPDLDRLTNLQEFAFDMDPTLSEESPLSFTTSSNLETGVPTLMKLPLQNEPDAFHVIFARRKDDIAAGLDYRVQFSADLHTWTESSVGMAIQSENAAGTIEAVSVPYPASVPVVGGGPEVAPCFFRIKIEN